MKLVDAKTMQALDRAAISTYGVKSILLMENAGRAVAEAVMELFKDGAPGKVAVIAGKGNNGGDGFVAARHLKNSGFDVNVFLLSSIGDLKSDAAANAEIWKRMGGGIYQVRSGKDLEKHVLSIRHAHVIVDAIFGTGLATEIKGLHKSAIEFVNKLGKAVVSVDVPSGIDASNGKILGVAVKADVTVTFALPKLGLYLYPGRDCAGRVEVVDIGIPRKAADEADVRWNLIEDELVSGILMPRPMDSHKGTYGHVLTIGGSTGKLGAPYMSAMGALRIGAGLSTIAAPKSLNAALESKTIEVMTLPIADEKGFLTDSSVQEVLAAIKEKTSVVVGPGLGNAVTYNFMDKVVGAAAILKVGVVIDADGLNALKQNVGALKKFAQRIPLVLTPHPGEAARLLGVTTSDVQENRLVAAERLFKMSGSTVVLKGASTIIAGSEGVFINPTGSPALASAGTGDVLSGMIGGLLAQGHSATEAAIIAVYLHGRAADALSEKLGDAGMLATDLLGQVPAERAALQRGQ